MSARKAAFQSHFRPKRIDFWEDSAYSPPSGRFRRLPGGPAETILAGAVEAEPGSAWLGRDPP